MAELGRLIASARKVSTMSFLARCLLIVGLIFVGSIVIGKSSTGSPPSQVINPETTWPVIVEGAGSPEEISLPIPLLISERILPTDSTITYSISIGAQEIEGITAPGVMLVRPLHSASATWDGVEVPLYSSHGGNRLDGDSSLLGLLPVASQSEGDSHLLTVTLTGVHGYLGVAKSVIIGEFALLERSQQTRELRLVFGGAVLMVIGAVLLFIGLYSKRRGEFVAAGLCSAMLALAILSLSDFWAVMPGGLEYRLRVRHAAIVMCPFFGLAALKFIVQESLGAIVVVLGVMTSLLATLSMVWPDSTILPTVRLLSQVLCLVTLVVGIKMSLKNSLQGVLEARVVLGVALSLLCCFVLLRRHYGMLTGSSLLVSICIGVCVAMMVLLIRRYLTSSERYAQFVSESFDAIIVVEMNGTVVESNASGRLLLGVGTMAGEGLVNLFEKVEPLDVELCRNHVLDGSGVRAELRFPILGSKAGSERTVFVESVAIALDKAQSLLVLRDVSQRSQIEGRIVSSIRMETLGIVARGIAHDYNNTLSAVLGQLTMLDHEVPKVDSDLIHEIERLIVDTSERTRKQLAIVRGGNEPSRAVDPIDLVESTSQLITGTLPKNVFLVKSFGEELPSVHCKAVEIEQVLLNLVTNSRDVLANKERGEIEIRAAKVDDDFVMFSITDDGPAIPIEHAHMVWNPFFSSSGRDLGAGLVLSVVQRVVREHGGKVNQVTPESGVGARFEVYIPTSDSKAHSEPKVATAKFGEVLVVEDEPNIREVMVSIMRLRGFTVAQAASAEEARELFKPMDFQLLVTDVILGSENGISLAEHFTKLNPRLAVLVVSGQVPEKLQISNDWAFLNKPFTPEMLVASARTAILWSSFASTEAQDEQ